MNRSNNKQDESVFDTDTGTDETTDPNEIAEIEVHMNISKLQRYSLRPRNNAILV